MEAMFQGRAKYMPIVNKDFHLTWVKVTEWVRRALHKVVVGKARG